METHSPTEDPDADGPGGTPAFSDASAARAALIDLDHDTARLATRVVTPWWYHPVLGALVATIVAAQTLPTALSVSLIALGVIGMPILVSVYSRRYGVVITAPVGPRSKGWLGLTLAAFGLAMVAGLLIKLSGLAPPWALIPAALVFVATIVLGRRYDQALRDDLAKREAPAASERGDTAPDATS